MNNESAAEFLESLNCRMPEAEPAKAIEKAPPSARYVKADPFSDRLAEWWHRQWVVAGRLMRIRMLIGGLPGKVLRFARAVLGGFVSKELYAERQDACASCPARLVILKMRRGRVAGHAYCNQCGCPKWLVSRLNVKNRLRLHECPSGKHPPIPGRMPLSQMIEEFEAGPSGPRST